MKPVPLSNNPSTTATAAALSSENDEDDGNVGEDEVRTWRLPEPPVGLDMIIPPSATASILALSLLTLQLFTIALLLLSILVLLPSALGERNDDEVDDVGLERNEEEREFKKDVVDDGAADGAEGRRLPISPPRSANAIDDGAEPIMMTMAMTLRAKKSHIYIYT